MKSGSRKLLIELIWLIIIFFVSAAIMLATTWSGSNNSSVDIHLHDTYFVVDLWHAMLPIFLFIGFLTYYIKEAQYRYSRRLPNVILLVIGMFNVILIAVMHYQLANMFTEIASVTGGSSGYLSDVVVNVHPVANFMITALIIWQVLVTLALVYFSYKWGRSGARA